MGQAALHFIGSIIVDSALSCHHSILQHCPTTCITKQNPLNAHLHEDPQYKNTKKKQFHCFKIIKQKKKKKIDKIFIKDEERGVGVCVCDSHVQSTNIVEKPQATIGQSK